MGVASHARGVGPKYSELRDFPNASHRNTTFQVDRYQSSHLTGNVQTLVSLDSEIQSRLTIQSTYLQDPSKFRLSLGK